jgi:bifunctional non-homologous end joining protein LigD
VKPSVPLTNPDRLVYPRDRISKCDVADYYHAVSGPMVRALKDRPIQFAHWPDGIDEPSWFQQNIGGDAEPWMTLVTTVTRTSKRPVRHLIPDRPEALRWLAQHSALEIHAWSSRARSLEEPDWVVFDLDPPEGSAAAVTTVVISRRSKKRCITCASPAVTAAADPSGGSRSNTTQSGSSRLRAREDQA